MQNISRIAVLFVLTILSSAAHAQAWKNESNMKVKRSEAASVVYKGEMYVFNGFSQGLFVGNSVEKYNPGTKKWTLLGKTTVDNGTAVTHTGTVLVGSDVWLLGGRVGAHPGRVTDAVWIYNINSKKWRKGPKLPKPMAGGGAALVNNKIYMFGGVDSKAKCDVNYNYEYNLSSPSSGWKNLTGTAPMPSARNHFSTVTLNNLIYAIGGQHGHDGCPGIRGGNVALVHTFNPKNKKWSRVANLPNAESHNEPGTFVHNGYIYSAGGNGAGNRVMRYDPKKNKWEQVAKLPEKLVAPVARIFNDRLVVGGGGAPITSKSKVAVRSLGSAKFKDVAGGATASDNSSSNNADNIQSNETNNNADSNTNAGNNNSNDNTSSANNSGNANDNNTSANNSNSGDNNNTNSNSTDSSANRNEENDTPSSVPASDEIIVVSGNNISWPDDGWYQVQNENEYVEVCAGGRSCQVASGSYVVINHTTGQRFNGIKVRQDQPTAGNSNSSNPVSPVVVSGNVISWPDDGWYQVQNANDYSEVCAGGSSCTVSPGKYNVINHNTGARFDGIEVTANAEALTFQGKLALFEEQANHVANAALLNINQQYVSGAMPPELAHCIPAQYQGLSIAPVVGCDTEQRLISAEKPITQYAYELQSLLDDQAGFDDTLTNCRESLENNSTDGCSLDSVNLFNDGLHVLYGTNNRVHSNNRSIVISDDALDVSGLVSTTPFGKAACFVEIVDDSEWLLLFGTDMATCSRRLDEALNLLE